MTLRAVDIKPHAQFKIELQSATSLRSIFQITSDLAQLMTLLTGEACYVTKLRLAQAFGDPVDVFFPSDVSKSTEIDSPRMSFPLREVRELAPNLFESWFNSALLLSPIYDLLFGTLFNPQSFVQSKFLNLMQALESLHPGRSEVHTCRGPSFPLCKMPFTPQFRLTFPTH